MNKETIRNEFGIQNVNWTKARKNIETGAKKSKRFAKLENLLEKGYLNDHQRDCAKVVFSANRIKNQKKKSSSKEGETRFDQLSFRVGLPTLMQLLAVWKAIISCW